MIKTMLQKLFAEVQTLLQRPTFADKGGFRVKLTGFKFIREPMGNGKESNRLDDHFLQFREYCNKVNRACDADQKSYDAMVFLTGRTDFNEVSGPNGVAGYADTGAICNMAPPIAVTMQMDNNGNPLPTVAKVLAHEFGHLLGSYHDGEKNQISHIWKKSHQYTLQCKAGEHLMSPSVGESMTDWSWCTKKAVKMRLEYLERNNLNCLYT